MGRSVKCSPAGVFLAIAGSVFYNVSATFGGIYTEAGIPFNSPTIIGWATGATIVRGPTDITAPGEGLATYGAAASATGAADGVDVVSLGDGGSATLTFASPIHNGAGADFAVFENGFESAGGIFAELAYVEVSSNGVNFFRFPSVSKTQVDSQVGTFGTIDPTDIYDLAGKHVAQSGTPFDLTELVGVSALLDVNAVSHVRVVDVVGNYQTVGGVDTSIDSLGKVINDPFKTNFASGGFDLDAVAVVQTPEPAGLALGLISVAGVLKRRRRS